MKKIASKMFIFFIALCFSLTLCTSLQAEENRKIDINTAGKAELMQLHKIGPQKADSIIEYREKIAPFETIEDLMNVSGIGKATYALNQDLITVSPPKSE